MGSRVDRKVYLVWGEWVNWDGWSVSSPHIEGIYTSRKKADEKVAVMEETARLQCYVEKRLVE